VGGEAETEDARRFAGWVEAGRAGEMEYLKRRDASGELVRAGLQRSLPWARSVLVCAMSYRSEGPGSVDAAPEGSGWIARYAWSGRRVGQTELGLMPTDYHDELLGRLRRVEAELQAETGCTTRCYVDTGPLLERGLAARAGIGWIGKNTCVLNEQLGSWLLLGVIVTSLDEGRTATLPAAADRCGSCTRCIEACPTDALLGGSEPGSPREMDANRCIAYLTIEKKGSIDPELAEGMGRQVFGCDICQEVCPWNAKAARSAPVRVRDGMEPRAELVNPPLEWLATMDSAEFKRRFKGSPLERTGRKRLLRNVAIAMGNSGEERFLPWLEGWGVAPDPTSANDVGLAEAAQWAQKNILGT
jgi:epoxyqueuosine reductase